MSIDITVCFPWRPQPDRMDAYHTCKTYWRSHGFNTVEADSDPTRPFVCNEARNNAARLADTDIIIIADADTVPENIKQINTAVERIKSNESDVVYPFTLYRYIPPEWTDKTAYLSIAPIIGETYNSPGGMIVTTQDSFWSINGFDPRFIPGASGFDDTAFMLAAQTLLATSRIYGTVYSFDHPVSVIRDYGDDNPNKTRYSLYEYATQDPALMRELVK